MTERWLPIPGYDGQYEVSNHGRVRSHKWHRTAILKQTERTRYPTVCLSKRSVQKVYRVHRLVLLAFVGPLPKGMHTRHLDGDPRNNHLSNLTYGTPSENALDKVRHGTMRNAYTDVTHCKYGHEFTPENTYHRPDGARCCRTCARKKTNEWAAKRRQKART